MLDISLVVMVVAGWEYYGGYVSAGCAILLPSDLTNKEPLFLTRINSRLEFFIPQPDRILSNKKRGAFELENNEGLIIACPGKSNKLKKFPGDVDATHCYGGTWFDLKDGKAFDSSQLECSRSVEAVLRPDMRKKCAKKGTEMKIGFEVEYEFLPLISLCHDLKGADTLFVEHDILASIGSARIFNQRPFFQEGPAPLYTDVKPKKVYTKEYQQQLFTYLLGEGEGERLIREQYFLSRGHLAPHADFLYVTWRWSTYFYANAVPQWQIINAGNWKSLEQYLRKLATRIKEDLHIITGVYGVMSLRSIEGKDTEIYLKPDGEKKIRVPAVIFKIVRSKTSNKAIAAITSNNPFEEVDMLCANIAEANHWPNWDDYTKGRIYFCDVKVFLKMTKVLALPRMQYSGILQGYTGQ